MRKLLDFTVDDRGRFQLCLGDEIARPAETVVFSVWAVAIVLASSDKKLIFQATFFLFLLKDEMCHAFVRLLSLSAGATDFSGSQYISTSGANIRAFVPSISDFLKTGTETLLSSPLGILGIDLLVSSLLAWSSRHVARGQVLSHYGHCQSQINTSLMCSW